jgi:hypothetical protein
MNLNIAPGMPLNRLHPDYAMLSNEQKRQIGLQKLEAYIAAGRKQAARVVETVLAEQPRDRYVRAARGLRFDISDNGHELRALLGQDRQEIVDHALDQVAVRAGLNLRFLHDLQGHKAGWADELAARNLNTMLEHMDDGEADPQKATRFLVREVGGRIRGVMSDAFKRLDSRPTVDALVGAAQGAKAVVVNGIYTETRVSIKVVRAIPIEVFPGEYMVFGLDYSNSDYGDGASEFSAFLLRLACLNGAIATHEVRKIHIGSRFKGADGIASNETLELDARAQQSLAQDMVRALLSDSATDHMVKSIRESAALAIEPKKIEGFLKAKVNKTEAKAITDKFNSPDIEELPPGQNAWRFSNAISWLARETEDARRKMTLEALAGEAMVVG